MKYLLLIMFSAAVHLPLHAAVDTDTSFTLSVSGNCSQCKKRIEKVSKIAGVTVARWDAATKLLTITAADGSTSKEAIVAKLLLTGHDVGQAKAPLNKYMALPDCCKYRDEVPENAHVTTELSPKSIKGKVLAYAQNGQLTELIGASIVWQGTHVGVLTDGHGFFELPMTSSIAKPSLVVGYAGYFTDTLAVQATTDTLAIVLRSQQKLYEVTVQNQPSTMHVSTIATIRTQIVTEKELFKAACCNLSESFETNPSVDVLYNDAVTGSKQIQMLGLSGNYTQLTIDNLPGPRGIATPWGLNSISGAWIEAIQLTKGIGSVVNGFESMAGQINVALKKPEGNEHLFANMYYNDFGKTDLNLNVFTSISKHWKAGVMVHHDFLNNANVDFNKDGFRDVPTGNQSSVLNRFTYSNKGWIWQLGLQALHDTKTGGEVAFNPATDKLGTHHYGLGIATKRYGAFSKLGYVFEQKKYKSLGLQLAWTQHSQEAYFGTSAYSGLQKSWYGNFIYQSIIGNTQHKYKMGTSVQSDVYAETWAQQPYGRTETVVGAFSEYSYVPKESFSIIAGLRVDHNNLYGWFVTPRLHIKYQPAATTTIRLSAGRGQRTANIFAENTSVWVSARQLQITGNAQVGAYGLLPEVSWNKGISIDQKLVLFHRSATLSIDYFRNDFTNQVIVDVEDARSVKMYNLEGKSYSNSVQIELATTPLRKLTTRLAYRFYDVQTTYGNQLLQKPLLAQHKAFCNVGYEVLGFQLDYTLTFTGSKRLPNTQDNPLPWQQKSFSPSFWLMNAQISKTIKVTKTMPFTLYVGGENLTNYFQKSVIVASESPFGKYFDASMVWGPVTGSMWYGGVRLKL
jgi:outer membrane receptor for ferrienterochelin and colicins